MESDGKSEEPHDVKGEYGTDGKDESKLDLPISTAVVGDDVKSPVVAAESSTATRAESVVRMALNGDGKLIVADTEVTWRVVTGKTG
jgi:hypothetical protein